MSNNQDVFRWTMKACLVVVCPSDTPAAVMRLVLPLRLTDVTQAFFFNSFFRVQMRLFLFDIAGRRGADLAAFPQHIVSIISRNPHNTERRCCAKYHKSGRKSQEVPDAAAAQTTFTGINGGEVEGLQHFQVIIGQRNERRREATRRQGGKLPNKTGSGIWTLPNQDKELSDAPEQTVSSFSFLAQHFPPEHHCANTFMQCETEWEPESQMSCFPFFLFFFFSGRLQKNTFLAEKKY